MGFGDPLLDSLIERAVKSNLDLRAAMLRIDEARAQRAISASAYWPTLSVDGSYTRQRFSETTPTGSLFNSVGNLHLPGGASVSIPNPYNQYQLSADASWEIDLFGRVRRSVEAAQAAQQVSIEDHRAMLVSVTADLAQSYVELRGAQARLRVATANLATIDELLDLTRQRLAAGLTTHIDVSNAAAQAGATRAELPAIAVQITQSVNQISQLLGREPEALRALLQEPAPVPLPPQATSIGLPAELGAAAAGHPRSRGQFACRHRADRRGGREPVPRLTLTAGGAFSRRRPASCSSGPAVSAPWGRHSIAGVRSRDGGRPCVSTTCGPGGRAGYQRTVLNALHEVENALAAYGADQQRRAWLEATVAQNRMRPTLSRQRYASGVANFIEVLDAQRPRQQNELALVDSTPRSAPTSCAVPGARGRLGTHRGRCRRSTVTRPDRP